MDVEGEEAERAFSYQLLRSECRLEESDGEAEGSCHVYERP
jgi:hypothetical protein